MNNLISIKRYDCRICDETISKNEIGCILKSRIRPITICECCVEIYCESLEYFFEQAIHFIKNIEKGDH